jgi:hypothetical protein
MTRLAPRTAALAALAVLLAARPAPAAAPAALAPAELQKARQLVHQLGDASYEARTQASRQLFKMGLGVKAVLLEGSRDTDPEVRRRCRELLPAVLEADRLARIDAFVADKDGQQDSDLPCWRRFRQVAGNDAEARKLFVEMQKGESCTFLLDVDQSPSQAGDLCYARCQHLQEKLYGRFRTGIDNGNHSPVTLADMAAVMLVASDPKVQMPNFSSYMVGNFLYQQTVRNALTGNKQTPFRKLVLAWIERQVGDDNGLQYALQMAVNLELKECLDLAVKAAKEKKVKGQGLGAVLTTIGKMGGKEHLPLLEAQLNDTTVIGNFGINRGSGTTEVRDAALAMLVHMTKQSHKDYGFLFAEANAGLMFNSVFLGFTNNAERDKAHRKWKEWKAAQDKKK